MASYIRKTSIGIDILLVNRPQVWSNFKMLIKRYFENDLDHFLGKIIFISGPRQSGKTYLVKKHFCPDLNLNLDDASDRLRFKDLNGFLKDWTENFRLKKEKKKKPCVFIDEIHRVRGWRNIIKASFDQWSDQVQFVASGSSAFNLRKQDRGDSLAGRAIWLHLFPVSFREYLNTVAPEIHLPKPWAPGEPLLSKLTAISKNQTKLRKYWEHYITFGSFPELLVRKSRKFSDEWLKSYLQALLDRDLKDLSAGRDAERCYQVYQLLMEGLGSTYSLRSLAQTLAVSPMTIKGDILALRQVLLGFELPALGSSKSREIQREKKFYPIDFSLSLQPKEEMNGAQFETIISCLFYRDLHSTIFAPGSKIDCGFYRTYEKKEVDCVIRINKKNLLAIECKLKPETPSSTLMSLNAADSLIVTAEENIFERKRSATIVSAELLMALLN